LRLKQIRKYFTRTANLHLLYPVLAYRALTNGSVDKPAEISGFKFPGRTLFPLAINPVSMCCRIYIDSPLDYRWEWNNPAVQ